MYCAMGLLVRGRLAGKRFSLSHGHVAQVTYSRRLQASLRLRQPLLHFLDREKRVALPNEVARSRCSAWQAQHSESHTSKGVRWRLIGTVIPKSITGEGNPARRLRRQSALLPLSTASGVLLPRNRALNRLVDERSEHEQRF